MVQVLYLLKVELELKLRWVVPPLRLPVHSSRPAPLIFSYPMSELSTRRTSKSGWNGHSSISGVLTNRPAENHAVQRQFIL
jgi:hypothetical protein